MELTVFPQNIHIYILWSLIQRFLPYPSSHLSLDFMLNKPIIWIYEILPTSLHLRGWTSLSHSCHFSLFFLSFFSFFLFLSFSPYMSFTNTSPSSWVPSYSSVLALSELSPTLLKWWNVFGRQTGEVWIFLPTSSLTINISKIKPANNSCYSSQI